MTLMLGCHNAILTCRLIKTAWGDRRYCGQVENIVMRIDEKIIAEIVEFETNTGLKPQCIYLGRNEWNALKHFAEKIAGFRYYAESCPEFMGKKIHIVHDSNHVGVGA
jgi:hypothetical protein